MLLPLLSAAVSLAIAVVACVLFHFPIGPTSLILLVVWPLVGILITIDDDLPGGWSNPDGTLPPPWKCAKFWAEIIFRLACALGACAVGEGWKTSEAVVFWWFCGMTFLASVGLWKRGLRGN